jgi:hypothetical protein
VIIKKNYLITNAVPYADVIELRMKGEERFRNSGKHWGGGGAFLINAKLRYDSVIRQ